MSAKEIKNTSTIVKRGKLKRCAQCKKVVEKPQISEAETGKVWCSLTCCLGVKID